ncbi:MAG: phosphotransferase family protein [Rhodobacterales bacterium]
MQDADEPPFALKAELEKHGVIHSPAMWEPLRGGRTNRLWYVTSNGAALVVKLYNQDAATPLFDNDPLAEAAVLGALSGSALSPEAVFSGNTQSGPVLVYRHISGEPWRSDPSLAATVLKSLHTTVAPYIAASLPSAPDGSLALKAQTRAILDQIPSAEAARLRAIEPDSDVAPSEQICLLHGDPVPDNIVCTQSGSGGEAVLIDWQCPRLGDPLLDLSLFLSPAMQIIARGQPLTLLEHQEFIEAYDDPPTAQRLLALQPDLHWRMASYCLWKITRAKPDFAYAKALEAEVSALIALTTR